MTPREQAQELCERLGYGVSWQALRDLYARPGCLIIDTQTVYCHARPVPRSATWGETVMDECKLWPLSECDTWCVALLAGSILDAMASVPVQLQLPYVCYGRPNGGLHFARLDRIRAITESCHTLRPSSPLLVRQPQLQQL